jgi:hypothetical protein
VVMFPHRLGQDDLAFGGEPGGVHGNGCKMW